MIERRSRVAYISAYTSPETVSKEFNMSLAMYEAQRKKLAKLFHEHALQEAVETARQQSLVEQYERDRAYAYANWYPPNPPPVSFAGLARAPIISTRPYTMHTTGQIASLQNEYATNATMQQQFEQDQQAGTVAHVGSTHRVQKRMGY